MMYSGHLLIDPLASVLFSVWVTGRLETLGCMESDSLRFWVECRAWIIVFVSPVIAIGSEWTQDGENPVRVNLRASA